MNLAVRMTTLATITAAVAVPTGAAQAVDPCVSGAEVRAQVHALVASIKDDVKSRDARAATRAALLESLATFRGAQADTPKERRELGQEISALAKQLHAASNRVERKALVAEILALTEQRQRGGLTAEDRAELRAALRALRQAVVARASNAGEGAEISAAFKALHEQFNCTPA